MATLRTKNLTKSYSGRTVVREVSLDVNSGEVVGLLGPNGAGKTTTFYMVVGLTAPDKGHVILDGKDVTDDPMYIRARKGIGYLPQEPSIFRGLTVEQNISFGLRDLGMETGDGGGQVLPGPSDRDLHVAVGPHLPGRIDPFISSADQDYVGESLAVVGNQLPSRVVVATQHQQVTVTDEFADVLLRYEPGDGHNRHSIRTDHGKGLAGFHLRFVSKLLKSGSRGIRGAEFVTVNQHQPGHLSQVAVQEQGKELQYDRPDSTQPDNLDLLVFGKLIDQP